MTADNVGRFGLLITLQANPSTPTTVSDGDYNGRVVVDRSSGGGIGIKLNINLQDRTGKPTVLALFCLLLGASVGGFSKWVSDVLAPLAPLRRKYLRLATRLDRLRDQLPHDALDQLSDVRDSIRHADATLVAEDMKDLAAHQVDLIAFGRSLREITRQLGQQSALQEDLDNPLHYLSVVMEAERVAVDDLRNRNWPWTTDEGKAITDACEHAKEKVRRITADLRGFIANPTDAAKAQLENTLAQVSQAGAAWFTAAEEALPALSSAPDLPPSGQESLVPSNPKASERRASGFFSSLATAFANARLASNVGPAADRSPREILIDWVSKVTILLGGVVVVFVGYLTQFSESTSFSGGLSEYLTLVGWAFAVQVTGVTVIDLAGRVGGGRLAASDGA